MPGYEIVDHGLGRPRKTRRCPIFRYYLFNTLYLSISLPRLYSNVLLYAVIALPIRLFRKYQPLAKDVRVGF